MKTNFKRSKQEKNQNKDNSEKNQNKDNSEKKPLTKKEFEEFIHKSGAKGSFMVYRSTKKDDELGIDEL
tara:strand:+ start:922 stop:1128 length:207 start_codon:yes stop_codon:yes gene_type:complete